jgi:gp16 family phage-associated protein
LHKNEYQWYLSVHFSGIEGQTQMTATSSSDQSVSQSSEAPLTPAQIKRRLWADGSTLKQWAADNGYAYSTVSAVMSGKIKVKMNYGKGYEIAIKLGPVAETANGQLLRAKAVE